MPSVFALVIVVGVILLIVIATALILRFTPAFGGLPARYKNKSFQASEHYQNGKFVNQLEASTMDRSLKGMASLLGDQLKTRDNRHPKHDLPVVPLAPSQLEQAGEGTCLVSWFGHSAVLLKLNGSTILLDPMMGPASSPVTWIGSKRYAKTPIQPEDLPELDVVIFSHDHYDHLDYPTVRKLKDKVGLFIVPLGVGFRLQRFGVSPDRIKELDWYEETEYKGIRLVCAPARHFSGRALLDHDTTLWASWMLITDRTKIFFSGDSGYGPHFKEIGRAYGPFDLAIMECGQYDRRWADIHMVPEQTALAAKEVEAKLLLPVHWAGFTLALHGWTEPVERLLEAAKQQKLAVMTPKIGELVQIGLESYPTEMWWRRNL